MIAALRWAALLLVFVPGTLAAQPPDHLAQLKRKAAEWDKIVGQVQGTTELKVEHESKDRKSKKTFTRTFKQNATGKLMFEKQESEGSPNVSNTAQGFNADYGFQLNEQDGNWKVRQFSRGDPDKIQYANTTVAKIVTNDLSFQFPSVIFDAQQFRLEKTEVVRVGKRQLFKVNYTMAHRDDMMTLLSTVKGVFSFDIDRSLALVAIDSESVSGADAARKSCSKSTFEYDGQIGGFPRLKRHVVETVSVGGAMDGKTTTRTVTTYDLRLDAKAPDREFTLSAFGLPEPVKEKDAK